MVKSQCNWNDYVKNFEPFELEENYRRRILMELFSLKFDFGTRKCADISGEMTIMHHPIVKPLFREKSTKHFQDLSSGIFTPLNEGMELPIDATGDVRFKIDLVDKIHGALEFQDCFTFELETENAKLQRVEDGDGGGDDDDEDEEEDEEEEEEEEEYHEEGIDDKMKERLGKIYELYKAIEAARHNRFDLWDRNRDCSDLYDKLLRKKFDSPHCSIEVMYAVYKDARAVTVEFSFADWSPESSNGRRKNQRIRAFNHDLYPARSDGLYVFGKVTASNSLLESDHATTVLFDTTIRNSVHLKLSDPIPFLKTLVVFPRKETLKLNIDLKRAVDNRYYEQRLHKASPSEPLVTKTLEITNQSVPFRRYPVDDAGPANLLVDVTFHD